MNFKYTAGIVSLFIACPLADPTVSFASYWKYYDQYKTWIYNGGESSSDSTQIEVSDNNVTTLPESRPEGSLDEEFHIGCTNGYSMTDSAWSKNNTFTYNTRGNFKSVIVGSAAGCEVIALPNQYFCKSAGAINNQIFLTDANVLGKVICGEAFGQDNLYLYSNTVELNGGTYGGFIGSCIVLQYSHYMQINLSDFVTKNQLVKKPRFQGVEPSQGLKQPLPLFL